MDLDPLLDVLGQVLLAAAFLGVVLYILRLVCIPAVITFGALALYSWKKSYRKRRIIFTVLFALSLLLYLFLSLVVFGSFI